MSFFCKSKYYKHLGKPKFDSLQAGDILYVDNDSECHYALYLGDGKMAEMICFDDEIQMKAFVYFLNLMVSMNAASVEVE